MNSKSSYPRRLTTNSHEGKTTLIYIICPPRGGYVGASRCRTVGYWNCDRWGSKRATALIIVDGKDDRDLPPCPPLPISVRVITWLKVATPLPSVVVVPDKGVAVIPFGAVTVKLTVVPAVGELKEAEIIVKLRLGLSGLL